MSEMKGPVTRRILLGFVGTLVVGMTLLFLVLWRLSPVVQVDQATGKVRLLDGLIEVERATGKIHLSGRPLNDSEAEYRRFSGSRTIDPAQVTKVSIPFQNAKIELSPSAGRELTWRCNLDQKDRGEVHDEKGELMLDLAGTQVAQCGFSIPAGMTVILHGGTGEVTVHKPSFHLDAKISNGEVELLPDPARHYVYDLGVGKGRLDRFDSSTAPDALRITVFVRNGNIRGHSAL